MNELTVTNFILDLSSRITKCHFHKYGPSGTIEVHDAMCVLALNIINEKIYVGLWFWYIILAVLTSLYLIYVICVIAIPSMRRVMVERNAKYDVKVSEFLAMPLSPVYEFVLFRI